MSFTIEDMLIDSSDRYRMKMIAGSNGWSNSISWIFMLEELTIINNFRGKELAVTTGLGFRDEKSMLQLVQDLIHHHAAGLIVNTGYYVYDIPESVREMCNENDFPLLTVPWDIYIADMIKDLSIRVFLQGSADEQIATAFIDVIEHPESVEKRRQELLPYFDTDGQFQVFVLHSPDLDKMDTVDRKRIEYGLQIAMENITHNSQFFYYDGSFVFILNAVEEKDARRIVHDFTLRTQRRMPDLVLWIGGGSIVTDLSCLPLGYARAMAAALYAEDMDRQLVYFDEMDVYRLIYLQPDRKLLQEMSSRVLAPLIAYDERHDACYVDTLEEYLACGESIQEVARRMYTHRNTILYRVRNIKKLLGTSLKTPQERLVYRIACLIRHTRFGGGGK